MKSKYINTFDTTSDYNNYIESALPEFPNVGYDKQAGDVKITRTSPNSHLFYGELVDATQNIPQIKLNKGNYNVKKTYTPTVDTLNNSFFYIDDWGTLPDFDTLNDMFLSNKGNIKTIKKFKGLNTSSVTNMEQMFANCLSLTSLDLSGLDTSNVNTMKSMFYYDMSLTSIDLSNFDTSSVTNILNMFYYCNSMTLLNLNNCDFSNVTTQPTAFYNCSSLTDVYVNVEATLMKITNNLSSQDNNGSYIPSNNGNCTIHYNDVDYKWQNNAWTPQS